ncbi:hypothetical protein M3676_27225 [Metabacillus litoralis]|nr:hypothetical protein [Metabacillus litoralis]
MNDKTTAKRERSVVHRVYERQNKGEGRGVSFIGCMNDKTKAKRERSVVHQVYERQNEGEKGEECRSSGV